MLAIKATFDGKKIVLPRSIKGPPSSVIVVFEMKEAEAESRQAWLKAQESVFAKAWDNEEDAIYETL